MVVMPRVFIFGAGEQHDIERRLSFLMCMSDHLHGLVWQTTSWLSKTSPTPLLTDFQPGDEIYFQESQTKLFKNFLIRANRYPSLQIGGVANHRRGAAGSGKKKIVLVEVWWSLYFRISMFNFMRKLCRSFLMHFWGILASSIRFWREYLYVTWVLVCSVVQPWEFQLSWRPAWPYLYVHLIRTKIARKVLTFEF